MSPLELFRRNQKVMMTGLILLAMFAFVVLPTVSQYMRSAGGSMSDPVLAEFEGVSLTASRVTNFTQKHYQTVQFLRKLGEETVKRGKTPQVPGFSLNQQTGEVQSVGINGSPNTEMSIRTMQFAAQAEENGFELDDTSLSMWLERYTAGTMSEREIMALLRRETNNQMGQMQLYDMLRKQLLANLYFRGAGANVSRGQFAMQSPLDHWKNFLKLNQQATVNAYGVLVNDYVEQTDANPSESEIVKVFEDGKNRFANEQSPEPGFRKRATATFEYLMADLQAFRDIEIAKLSDEQIKAEYDKQISGGAFQLPANFNPESESETESTADSTSSEPTASEPTASEPSSTEEMQSPSNPEPASETEPATDADTGEAAADKQAEEAAAAKAAAKAAEQLKATQAKQVADFAKELELAGKLPPAEPETPASDNESPKEDQEPKESESTEPSDDEKSAPKSDAEGEKAEDSDAENSDAEDSENDSTDQAAVMSGPAVRLVAAQADDQTDSSEEATDAKPEPSSETADQPGEQPDQPGNSNKPQEEPEPKEPEPKETEPEPKFRPFEEVRDQVAQSMVENTARVNLDQAVTKARQIMRSYSRSRAIHESGSESGEPPERPNLKQLASELGLGYRKIGPHDSLSLDDEPISDSFEEGTALSQRGVPFITMMFGDGDQFVSTDAFTPSVSVDLERQRTYLTWKTEHQEGYIPELDEVRDEVIQAIRTVKARELARSAAESIAEQANGEATLKDLVPENRTGNYYTDLGPFSWLTMVGFGGITIGNVEELDSVGNDFMKAVFEAADGEHVVAENGPKRVFYVVRRTSLQPATTDLKAIFSQQSQRMMAMFISDGSAGKVQQGFFDAVDEKTGYQRYEYEE